MYVPSNNSSEYHVLVLYTIIITIHIHFISNEQSQYINIREVMNTKPDLAPAPATPITGAMIRGNQRHD